MVAVGLVVVAFLLFVPWAPRASPFIGSRKRTGVTMDKGSSLIARWSGLPGLEVVWPSFRLRRPPTPDDVVVALIVSSQYRSYCPVVLPGAVLIMAVIQGWPSSRRRWPLSCLAS